MTKTIFITLFLLFTASCGESWQREDDCILTFKHFKGSTTKIGAAPAINTNGTVGVAVVSTGEVDQHITIWECKELGTITSTDEEIFRLSKSGESRLSVSHNFIGTAIDKIIKKNDN